MSDTLATVVVGVLAITGGIFFLITGVALLRARDAVTRVNLMGPATGVGLPLVILAALVHDTHVNEFSWENLVLSLLAIVAALVVSSIASNTLGRAAYRSEADLDPSTQYNDLED